VPDIRFYTDEHIPTAVVNGLRQRCVEVISTPDAGNLSASDEVQLKYATENELVVVTQDDDFLTLVASSTDHKGVAFAKTPMDIGSMVRALSLLTQTLTAEEMIGHIEYLRR